MASSDERQYWHSSESRNKKVFGLVQQRLLHAEPLKEGQCRHRCPRRHDRWRPHVYTRRYAHSQVYDPIRREVHRTGDTHVTHVLGDLIVSTDLDIGQRGNRTQVICMITTTAPVQCSAH